MTEQDKTTLLNAAKIVKELHSKEYIHGALVTYTTLEELAGIKQKMPEYLCITRIGEKK